MGCDRWWWLRGVEDRNWALSSGLYYLKVIIRLAHQFIIFEKHATFYPFTCIVST